MSALGIIIGLVLGLAAMGLARRWPRPVSYVVIAVAIVNSGIAITKMIDGRWAGLIWLVSATTGFVWWIELRGRVADEVAP